MELVACFKEFYYLGWVGGIVPLAQILPRSDNPKIKPEVGEDCTMIQIKSDYCDNQTWFITWIYDLRIYESNIQDPSREFN
jgi:hypothetical protein